MPQLTQLSLSGASHSNQRLFSDYYLDNKLPENDAWKQLLDEADAVMKQLQKLYANFTPSTNEAQTEENWIRPVLRVIGYGDTFEVQAPLKTPDGTRRPDYFFYPDKTALLANKDKLLTEENLRQAAFAVGDAKYWERPLDQALKGSNRSSDPFTNKNPSYQIFFYMLHSGLPWGILTNGRHWRLYHSQTAHKLEVFYEVDLLALLEANDAEKFLYFYAFFRREAFEPGPISLEQILVESIEYAQSVSDNLRQQVYDALRYVAQGFLDYPDNNLEPTPESCKLIYDNSLILLYRLLFILYAESRDLLPLQDNRPYRRKYSLDAIKNDAVTELEEELLLPTSSVFWSRLRDLFKTINLGNPPLNVTTFNGGLFDPKRHDFLEHYVAGDLSLCQAIDQLARVNGQFVNYRDLAERHLGTIYEGLLEYTLQVATEPMVELRSSSKIVPAQGVARKDIAAAFRPGEVYLVTDLGERKLTGSYYTPDYIVKYMVEQALRPILEAAVQDAQTDTERIEAVLAINVLDPSMGSGHFPVEVTEYIARFLVELGVQLEGTEEADLAYWKRRVAQQCIYGVDLNPLAVELAKLSLWLITAANDRPLSFLDHHLRTGNALIGSWLSEVTAGQHPGAKQAQQRAKQAEEATKETGQLLLLSGDEFRQNMSEALDSIIAIEHSPGVTVKDVKAQEAAYEELRQRFVGKYLYLMHLGVALYFDLKVGHELWSALANYAIGKAVENVQPQQCEELLDQATALADKKRFFHWELEFPDIFFDHEGQSLGAHAGFDVVIGNPPYMRQEQLGADKPFFQERYEVYHGVADLFVYFFAQGLRLLHKGGRLAYISSNTWLHANYGTPLRRYLRTQTVIETLIDLGNNRVFADAPDLTPAIQIVRKTPSINGHTAQVAVFPRGEDVTNFRERLADKQFTLSIYDQLDTGWQLTGDAPRALVAKLLATGKRLREVAEGQIYRGVLTGLNKAFIIDQATRDRLVKADPACAAIIKPVLRGEDLRPWYQENEGRWLIRLPNGWTADSFPNLGTNEVLAWEKFAERHPGLAAYLGLFTEAGHKRQDKGQFWWELRPCDYYEAFEKPKILWPDITRKPRFSWGEPGIYIGNTGYCIPTTSYALLGILASRTTWYMLSRISQPLGERAGTLVYRLIRQYIERLPIPPLTESGHLSRLVQQLTEKAKQRYEVRRKTTYRIQSDLGTPDTKPNQRLTTWWELPFKEFRLEVKSSFKRDIPVKDRDDWEALLRVRSAEIERLTREIVRLETELNAAVYAAFDLNEEEIRLIEQETKYEYGEW